MVRSKNSILPCNFAPGKQKLMAPVISCSLFISWYFILPETWVHRARRDENLDDHQGDHTSAVKALPTEKAVEKKLKVTKGAEAAQEGHTGGIKYLFVIILVCIAYIF